MTYITIPIAAKTADSAGQQITKAAHAGAEILELRLDSLPQLNAENVSRLVAFAKATELGVIATCRDNAEGGTGDWPQDVRTRMLCEAIQAGADYVDCELANYYDPAVREPIDKSLAGKPSCRLILSCHNFEGTFTDLTALYKEMADQGGRVIPKLAYTAKHINDCFPAIDLLRTKDRDAIVICMGEAGYITRVLAKRFGSYLTFACLDEQCSTAPGQVSIDELKNLYRWDSIGPNTRLFGVIGSPIAHSMSPPMFNAIFEHKNLDCLYLLLRVDGEMPEFAEFMDNITDRERVGLIDFGGFSVTLPHKAHAVDYAEEKGEYLEPLAATIGAVNTLKVGVNGRVSGFNTDYAGALDAITSTLGIERHGLHGKKVAVVGAGGVGRAVVAGLADVGAKIVIYNRTIQKAKDLAGEFHCKYAGLDELTDMDAEIIVNCTSIGMHPDVDSSPVPRECIKQGMVVFDTIYNPLETKILQYAREAGAKTVSGAEMFVRQAMKQFKIYFGEEPPEQIMRKAVSERLGGEF
ncbi:shikimate dehydrogenase [Anaerohalosphaera lusitana]|nr:shikimate dehydrogenase [Anaerohalosphaera lusitana]